MLHAGLEELEGADHRNRQDPCHRSGQEWCSRNLRGLQTAPQLFIPDKVEDRCGNRHEEGRCETSPQPPWTLVLGDLVETGKGSLDLKGCTTSTWLPGAGWTYLDMVKEIVGENVKGIVCFASEEHHVLCLHPHFQGIQRSG